MYDETDMPSHVSSTTPILQHCHRNETVFPHCTDGLHVTVNNIHLVLLCISLMETGHNVTDT